MSEQVLSEQQRPKRPAFYGLTWQKHEHFSFMRPTTWHLFEWVDDREGVLFGPTPEDTDTLFAVDVKDIGIRLDADDLADLEAGFLDGIENLAESQIEWRDTWTAGAVMGIEAKYTFREGEQTRKRWVRVLYQDSRQITVTAQGATVEEYHYWLPMFNEQMMTFKVHSGHASAPTP